MKRDELIHGQLVIVDGPTGLNPVVFICGSPHYNEEIYCCDVDLYRKRRGVGINVNNTDLCFPLPVAKVQPWVYPIGTYPRNQLAYKAMLTEAIRQGQPQAYTDDLLIHDASALGVCPTHARARVIPDGSPFGWIMRDHGTQIIPPDYIGKDNAATYWNDDRYKYYWWCGKALHALPDAKTLLSKHFEFWAQITPPQEVRKIFDFS